MLAVIIAVAVGVRLIFELLEPLWPYLMAGLIVFTIFRLVRWYRERW